MYFIKGYENFVTLNSMLNLWSKNENAKKYIHTY